MVGTQTDGSGKHAVQREGDSGASNGARPPVLGSMSEAELEAAISRLRTDKNLVIPPAPAPSARWGATTERLLRSGSGPRSPAELAAAREEAARHAWFVALGDHVAGPIDLAALRTHWEQGELGPDSLCWREGFEGWQPVCRVPALSEVLVPSPEAPVSARHMVPVERTSAPDFQLKGAEALRELTEGQLPPLMPEAAPELPPFLEPEPVTAPAAPALLDAVPIIHPVIAPTQVEVRIRGGVWLAFGGGLVGGVLVALVLWGLDLRNGTGPDPHTAITGAPGFTVPLGTTDLKAAASGVSGPALTAPAPLAPPAPVHAEATPQRVVLAPRPVVTTPPLRKLAKVDVALEQEAPVKEAPEAPPAADEELDEALGPDEAFARELDGPPAGTKRAVAKRTVWVPPAPAGTETPASLAQSDVFAVVLANKGDIAACVGAGKPQGEEEGKRVVVRWTIAPSGKVTDVVTETASFQGTALAHCLEAKIRAWTFPKHRVQGGAVRFPFVF